MSEADAGRFWRNDPRYSDYQADNADAVEQQLYDLFVKEYLYDHDRVRAARRCGFTEQYAKYYADKLWGEPYVQQQLRIAEERISKADKDVQNEDDEELVRRTLRHVMQVGTSAARVSAASKMSTILGLDSPTKTETTVTHRGGVMAVPSIAGLDEWEKAALASQVALQQANLQ